MDGDPRRSTAPSGDFQQHVDPTLGSRNYTISRVHARG
jgi:hypothetical protein